ncbi:alpha-2B adrenergic receptor-like [Paramacrobiotus metropolitanus]|uniref:alpha-2B adrenergic receptor-like n=1 Tax=Paramacrobiotus metropolitanus TaxID=2943436 RepID=UPI0024455F01|nr:alpha-2B adrenergic receptor-like [Paramacrobiotus metropolitanus]
MNRSHINISSSWHRESTVFMGYLYLILTVFSYFSNIFLLLIYHKNPSLKTPFSVYVVSLSICDLSKSLSNGIMKTTNNLQVHWFLSDPYCLLSMFCARILTSIMMYIQVLISCNRWWAVTFPNHYRIHHNKKVAACLVFSVVVFVNAWSIPGFILEDVHERKAKDIRYCFIPFAKPSVYFYVCGAIIHLLPQAVVVGIYPFIYYKVRVVLRKKTQIGTCSTSRAVKPAGLAHSASATGSLRSHFAGSLSTEPNNSARPSPAKQGNPGRWNLPGSRHFTVLTALFISATLLWTPTHVAYVVAMSGTYVDFRFLGIANFLFALDCTLNPLLCMLLSKEWRNAAVAIFRFPKSPHN